MDLLDTQLEWLLNTHRTLNGGSGTLHCDAAVLYGRHDRLVADKGAQVYMSNEPRPILVPTGGVGKDSGDLKEPEAYWLGDILVHKLGIPWHHVMAEPKATHGGENSWYSLTLLEGIGLKSAIKKLGLVIHAISAGRLAATMRRTAEQANWKDLGLVVIPTDYPFDPRNEQDQRELVGEVLRIMLYGLHDILTLPPTFNSVIRGEIPSQYALGMELGKIFDPELHTKVMTTLESRR